MARGSPKRWRLLYALHELAKLGSLRGEVPVSTEDVGERLGCSRQTASRYLAWLEAEGLIERSPTARGAAIRLTARGFGELEGLRQSLSSLLGEARPTEVFLRGEVFSGLKEGAYYVGQEAYRRQFVAKLGFDPHPGTLNVRLRERAAIEARRRLASLPALEIHGFTSGGRSFGSAKCFHAVINDRVRGAVVIAERTHYDDTVVELLAPVNLRKELGLRNGDRVSLRVIP